MTDHYIELRYSKDGGHNWSNWRTFSTGGVGAYTQRILGRRFGMGRQIVFQTRDSSPRRCDILAMSVQVSGG
jgi:hypothetical protein